MKEKVTTSPLANLVANAVAVFAFKLLITILLFNA
jgi:hypothetical protein